MTMLWCSGIRHFKKQRDSRRSSWLRLDLLPLILLDESHSGLVLQDHDPEQVVRFVPCVLKKPLTNEWVPGRALGRKDGILLAMLDLPVGEKRGIEPENSFM